ncbi:MAG TPA: leucyl/phenylalanyl-tRNA--protein transferase [Burkholderiaceae bacterium]|nr:leucyl/phenylalanyl-tRNA--protein transferase [Burkholderiaceae bacterium]
MESALREPNGLLAVSQGLQLSQLVDAYRQGIFPWYSEDEPIVWWSPDPRLVLQPSHFKISRSLRKRIRSICASENVRIELDRSFVKVMHCCAAPRRGQEGTWITRHVLNAYSQLHDRGLAHSIETWVDGQLVGGLYGVALGRMFYGESMFALHPDASKIALTALVFLLQTQGVALIDCQQETSHLKSLGAQTMSRRAFCAHVRQATAQPPIHWQAYQGQDLKTLLTVI